MTPELFNVGFGYVPFRSPPAFPDIGKLVGAPVIFDQLTEVIFPLVTARSAIFKVVIARSVIFDVVIPLSATFICTAGPEAPVIPIHASEFCTDVIPLDELATFSAYGAEASGVRGFNSVPPSMVIPRKYSLSKVTVAGIESSNVVKIPFAVVTIAVFEYTNIAPVLELYSVRTRV